MNLRIGGLFEGCGGLTLGVQAALGGGLAWYSEIEPAAARLLEHHHPDVPNLGDVTAVDYDQAAVALARALAVPCRSCNQPAGELCVRATDGRPLERFVAHPVRINDAGAHLGDTDPRKLGGAVHCRRDDCRRCHPPATGHGYPVPDDDPAADQGWYRP